VKSAKDLRWDLRALGLSDAAIDAAWPEWWSDAAEPSTSARSELRFSISRKLGLDPKSLLNDEPRFVWKDEAKYKRLTTESEIERAAIVSFGASVGRSLLSATAAVAAPLATSPGTYRDLILRHDPYVTLPSLLTLCWTLGIPVIHLRVFPLRAKKMSAMIVRVNGRFAILLAKDANYPSPIAFYLAHELGHAALGHIDNNVAVVELGDALLERDEDVEELQADRYALELLTGMPAPTFVPIGSGFNAPALANVALNSAADLKIDPGMIALCFGHSTGAWPSVFSALGMIYDSASPVWKDVNRIASSQLNWSALGDDSATFLRAVMGGDLHDDSRHRQ
jgi:hypothetical protein